MSADPRLSDAPLPDVSDATYSEEKDEKTLNDTTDQGKSLNNKSNPHRADLDLKDKGPAGDAFINNKAYFLKSSNKDGHNLYDHLSKILSKILDERPENVLDVFEDFSKKCRKERFSSDVDTIQERTDKSTETALAEIQRKLFTRSEGEEEADFEDDIESPLPNLAELMFYFEQAGIGLAKEEIYRVWLALKQLVDSHPVEVVRFWGKIIGTEQNYYVAEVEYRDGEGEEEEEEEVDEEQEDEKEKEQEKERLEDNEEEEENEEIPIPEPDFEPPPKTKFEDKGTGCNKKTYFVCNEPGKPWTKLPTVTPQQITIARKIKKYFTGRLDAPVICYPPFPGTEINYLRAQIARISAAAQISPIGFYQFGEEEEEEEEEGRDSYTENPEYEPLTVRELSDPTLQNWVHHTLHILPQGRTVWWNPQKKEDEFEEEEDEEEPEEIDELEPEVGPPLLTPLSEDAEIDNLPPWTTKVSSNLIPQYAVCVVHSNLWPGAHAFAHGRKFENIYIGWGHKYSKEKYSPPTLPPTLEEFPSVPDITEMDDPTAEEEAALRDLKAEAEEAEEEEEEDGEDEEDEDDD